MDAVRTKQKGLLRANICQCILISLSMRDALPLSMPIDIDECENGDATCDTTNGGCTNTDGSYECTCASGWTKEDDNSCSGMYVL